ncbi:MAG: lactate racemase domain-containing protein [Polyangiaceae bacterium]
MSHPQVVTIDRRSVPRTIFSGDQLVQVDMPLGSRVIYPKPPLAGLKDPDAAIRYALNYPLNSDPLHARLRPGMKVLIAIDDISMPLPPMKRPDVRERILTIVLGMLADHGVEDIELVIATAFHRRMRESEIRHMVGDKIMDTYFPKKLTNHDAEDKENLVELGTTSEGEVVEISRKAVDCDLLIYVNMNFVPMNGGHKSMAVGLVGYRSLQANHNPYTLRKCDSYMDPKKSALNDSFTRMGKLVEEHVPIFKIEATVNNRMFDKPLEFLAKNEDDHTPAERLAAKALTFTLKNTPQPAREAIFSKVPAPYELTSVFAGETEAVHEKILEKSFEQYLVPVRGQADILVCGIPYISPYNVHAFLNPLLVSVMAQGYLFNLYRGMPMVKKGGTMIIFHPCTDKFDRDQHAPYIDFVHQLLPETRDAVTLHKKYEKKFGANPAMIQAYRTGHAYHPVHPFYMWYWGEPGRQHMGRVIVVGADNEYIPKLLGYETARSFPEAMEMAKDTAPSSPEVMMLHAAPMLMTDMSAV